MDWTELRGLQPNCIVSVTMDRSSDGDRDEWTEDMEFSQAKMARKRAWSEASSGREGTAKQVKKKIRAKLSNNDKNNEEWKAIITLSSDKGHVHPVQLTKAIEKEIGKIKYAKILNNGRILISAVNKKQQENIMKMTSLDGGKIQVHVPGVATKLRGVISNIKNCF